MLGATEAIVDALAAFSELSENLPKFKLKSYEAVTSYLQSGGGQFSLNTIAGIAGALGSYVDYGKAKNPGLKAAHALKMTGTLVSMFGGYVGTVHKLYGPLIEFVGLAIQAGGSYLEANRSDLLIFFQHCTWGKREGLQLLNRIFTTADWYPEELSKLKDDIPGQHTAFDEIIYDYELELSTDRSDSVMVDGGVILRVKSVNKDILVSHEKAIWKIKAKVMGKGIQAGSDYEFESSEFFDQIDVSSGRKIYLYVYPKGTMPDSFGSFDTPEQVSVSGEVLLDVFGDQQRILKRTFQEKGQTSRQIFLLGPPEQADPPRSSEQEAD